MDKQTLMANLEKCLNLANEQNIIYKRFLDLDRRIQQSRVQPLRQKVKSLFPLFFVGLFLLAFTFTRYVPTIQTWSFGLIRKVLPFLNRIAVAVGKTAIPPDHELSIHILWYLFLLIVSLLVGLILDKLLLVIRKQSAEKRYQKVYSDYQKNLAVSEPPLLKEIAECQQKYVELEYTKNQIGEATGLHPEFQNSSSLNSLLYCLDRGLCDNLQQALIWLDRLQRDEAARNEQREHFRMIEAYTKSAYNQSLRATWAAQDAARQAWLSRIDNIFRR